MAILANTQQVNYKSLPLTAAENDSVIYHFAAEVDKLAFGLPFPLIESQRKKDLLQKLTTLAKAIESKFKNINVRLFKLKLLAPGRIDDIFKQVKRPITLANYDVVCMIVCENAESANLLKEDFLFKEMENLFQQFSNHNIITAKNIRKAGNSFVHEHQTQGVFLFNYFYVEDTQFDFTPVWDHTSRWFAEYAHLNNSYLLKPIAGDDHFQYINHCYWPGIIDFVPPLLFKSSAKTFVLDNFSYNKAIAFPIIYTALAF